VRFDPEDGWPSATRYPTSRTHPRADFPATPLAPGSTTGRCTAACSPP